jgi:integrase
MVGRLWIGRHQEQAPDRSATARQIHPWIERYLSHYRPQLVGRSATPVAGDALWVSDGGRPLTAKGIGACVSAVMKRELNRDINPHLFRKIISTELAIRDPAHVGVAQPLLGHADYRTTQQAYNLGRALDASRRHHTLLQTIRSGAPAKTGTDSTIIAPRSKMRLSRPFRGRGVK